MCAWRTFLFLGFTLGWLLFATAAAAVGSLRHRDTVHAAVLKITVHIRLILFTLSNKGNVNLDGNTLNECWHGGRKTHRGREPSRTEERFLLLLKPPSLILRGATFLVLALFFFSWGFGAGFDFLRAFGPAAEQRAVSVSEFRTKFYSDICPLSSKAYLCLLLSWPCVEAAQVAAESQLEPAVLQLPVQPQPPWFQLQRVHWRWPALRWRQQLLSGGYWCWTLATWLREPSSSWTRQS